MTRSLSAQSTWFHVLVASAALMVADCGSLFANEPPASTTEPPKADAAQAAPVDRRASDRRASERGASDRKSADPPKNERQLAEERKARDGARKRGEITFDDLKFDIEKGGEFKSEMITPEIEELNKKTVKLRGFILPASVFQESGIKQFVLVRDNQECCFGPGAALYDCVLVEMLPGKTASFSNRVVTVKGKLEIDSESFRYPEGGHYAIYKMTAEEVK
jgi:hypothetical protein